MRETLLRKLLFLVCGMVVLWMAGCGSSVRQSRSGESYHLKYNFHYYGGGSDTMASIVNYVNCPHHGFLPYNTIVSVGRYRKGFTLRVAKTGELIYVVAPRKYLGNKTKEEYLDLILSEIPVSYTGLSEIDKKGISSGAPIEGMSKKGIMIALGYPAPSFTPDLDADVWHYWNSRFIKCNVHFKEGVVEYISKVN